MRLSLITALLLASPASAQIVGGDWPTHYHFDGPMAESHFGLAVSNAGDVNADGFDDMIFGAPYSGVGGLLNGGSAFVHSGADGSVLYQFNASTDYENLGYSVSNAGDVNNDGFDDVIVGAPFRQGAVAWSGSASVYSGADGTTLHLFDGAVAYDNFGFSVSNAGDVNADGFEDLIIGVPGAGPGGIYRAGSAFVYSGANGAILHQFHGSTTDSRFGWTVSNAGDVNADGFDDLIVGAMFAAPGGLTNAGSAFVYSGANGSILYQFDGTAAGHELGVSVSNAGDVDRDGFDDVILGSPGAGAALVHSGADGSILFRLEGHVLGHAVSNAGDVNADGFVDLLVGGTETASVFSGADGSTLQRFDGASGEYFGVSVSNAGDIHGDGRATIIVGASRTAPGGASNTGSVYVYGLDPYLTVDANSISAASGGTTSFELAFPLSAANMPYRVLFSASGTGPAFYGIDLPLSPDAFARNSFLGSYPFQAVLDMHGTLSVSATATASFSVPANALSAAVGRTLNFAAIVIPTGLLPTTSSVAVPIDIVP